jgi:hypothetical protein
VLGGQFGIVGLDHIFRALPLGGVDACGVQSPDGPLLAGARVFLGDATTEARTIVARLIERRIAYENAHPGVLPEN